MEKSKELKKKVLGIIILLVTAALAYAAYATLGGPSDTPDIEPGDIVSDLDPLTGVPLSGDWSFKLDIGNPGTASVSVAPNGAYLTMAVDGQNLFFYTTSSTVPYTYQTNQRAFELQEPDGGTTTGYAWYQFTAVDDDVIDGTLYHDTDVLGVVERSFHMELVDIELPDMEWFELLSGDWNLEYDDAETECDPNDVASFPDLATDITLDYEVDLDTDDLSGNLHLDVGGEDVYLNPGDDPNTYTHEGDGINAGLPQNEAGDALLDFTDDTFTAEYNVFGTAEGEMEGYVDIVGSNGCAYTVGFTGISS